MNKHGDLIFKFVNVPATLAPATIPAPLPVLNPQEFKDDREKSVKEKRKISRPFYLEDYVSALVHG